MKKPAIFLIIDIETTGHDPLASIEVSGRTLLEPWHEITEIGCVFAENPHLEPLGELYTLVKPEHPERCDPTTIPITNFPARYAAGEWNSAPTLGGAIRLLFRDCREFCKDAPAVMPGGQNWFFDWSFLFTAFAQLGIPDSEHSKFLSYKRFDTASMAIQELWDPREPLDMSDFSLRSGKLQVALGIPPEPKPHRAINGARQAYEVLKKLNALKLFQFRFTTL